MSWSRLERSLKSFTMSQKPVCIVHARSLPHGSTAWRCRPTDPTFQQEVGRPAESIVRFADDGDCPLHVVGSRNSSALKALALGSVSNRVAHHAPYSVLVVR